MHDCSSRFSLGAQPAWLAVLLAIALAGCGQFVSSSRNSVSGSGTVTAEPRDVGEFAAITLNGVGLVEVTQGPSRPLVVEADDNLLPLITTEVTNGTLVLSVKPDYSIRPTKPIRFVVQTPEIEKLAIQGSGQIDAQDLNSEELVVSVAGSGDVSVTGRVTTLSVTIDGAGNFRGPDLSTTMAKIRTNGAGNALVNASDELDVVVNGVGTIEYVGEPTVTQSINGIGKVRQRDEGSR